MLEIKIKSEIVWKHFKFDPNNKCLSKNRAGSWRSKAKYCKVERIASIMLLRLKMLFGTDYKTSYIKFFV